MTINELFWIKSTPEYVFKLLITIIQIDREKGMFTLKFCNYYETGDSSVATLCCQHYNVYQFKNRVEITLYKDFTSENGVTYTIADEDIDKPRWQVCYVENINGKTIDKIRPYHDNRIP